MFIRVPLLFFTLLFAQTTVSVLAAPAPPDSGVLEKRAISQTLFDDLVRYTKYSSAAGQDSCPRPLGNTRVLQFEDKATDTQGFIARDDTRKEIVVSFRGSEHPLDFLIDILFVLVPLRSSSIPSTFTTTASRTKVHAGFLTSFNKIASRVVNTVSAELAANPSYTVVSTGHSLGAALASIAGVTLKTNFPNVPVKVYTFGQPRTGDKAYADFVDSVVGVGNLFRVVHTNDFVTTIPPQEFGYRHHGIEYWNFQDPASPSTVKQCTGQEDPTCSRSRLSTIFDAGAPHLNYFGQVIGRNTASLCAA